MDLRLWIYKHIITFLNWIIKTVHPFTSSQLSLCFWKLNYKITKNWNRKLLLITLTYKYITTFKLDKQLKTSTSPAHPPRPLNNLLQDGLQSEASELDARQEAGDGGNGGDPIAMLRDSIPGTPGEDYPIYADAPETKFECEGRVNGG